MGFTSIREITCREKSVTRNKHLPRERHNPIYPIYQYLIANISYSPTTWVSKRTRLICAIRCCFSLLGKPVDREGAPDVSHRKTANIHRRAHELRAQFHRKFCSVASRSLESVEHHMRQFG